jgi:hypothetical protein
VVSVSGGWQCFCLKQCLCLKTYTRLTGSNSITGLAIKGLLIDPPNGYVGGVASPTVYGINEVTNNRNQLVPLGRVAANLWSIIISDSATMGGAPVSARSTTGFTVTCYGTTDSRDRIVIGNPN